MKVVLEEFTNTLNSIAGACFDAIQGFHLNLNEIENSQQNVIRQSNSTEPENVQLQLLDSAWHMYGTGNPNDPNSVCYHQSTQRDFKARNADGGTNHIFIGNMGLITIFSYWEHEFRTRLGDMFDVQSNCVQSDFFGDMRLIRNDILHNKGIATPRLSNCKILKWFKANDPILIDQAKFIELLQTLKRGIKIEIIKQPPTTTI